MCLPFGDQLKKFKSICNVIYFCVEILLMDNDSLDVSPFLELDAVESSVKLHYCTRQLNVVLTTNTVYKGKCRYSVLCPQVRLMPCTQVRLR